MNAPRAGAGALPWVFSNHGLRHSGGIERYLLTLVRGLHEQGVRPTVIAKTIDRSIEEAGWVDATAVSMFGVPGKLEGYAFDELAARLPDALAEPLRAGQDGPDGEIARDALALLAGLLDERRSVAR